MPFDAGAVARSVVAIAAIAILLVQGPSTSAAEPSPPRGAQSPLLSSCRLPNVAAEARCGSFDVLENPERPKGRHLSIKVAVLPAQQSPARPDPVVFFSGGPGESAIDAAADLGIYLAQMFKDRDIVLIDQRGTGRSSPLSCPLYSKRDPAASLEHFFPPAAVERCLKKLEPRSDLTQYSFLRFADDVEHVRTILGYGPVNVIGLSYGTRAAQVYLRAHPDSVRTAYLGSIVPIDVAMPLPFARIAQDVLDTTIAACEHDAECSAAFPKLRDETKQVFARLAAGEVHVQAPGTGQPVTLSAGRIGERVRAMLYKPESAATVPWTIHRAYLGDWRPFMDGILEVAREIDGEFAQGIFFSITCAEDVRFIREADIAPAVAGTYIGDYRVREQQNACAKWPKAALPANYREPVRSSVPTLFVSGDIDPATPKAFADHLAEGFAHHADILMRGQAHSGWSDCVERAYRRLVDNGSVDGIDTACAATPRPKFKTTP